MWLSAPQTIELSCLRVPCFGKKRCRNRFRQAERYEGREGRRERRGKGRGERRRKGRGREVGRTKRARLRGRIEKVLRDQK
jgi:hypothetical protein